MRPNVDARIFEVVSFAVLKAYYAGYSLFWGWTPHELTEQALVLYKTGRTNANDGGIDFVMRPLGRFFQVTEVVDARKYFLDIEKIERYPLTFVVKSERPIPEITAQIEQQAKRLYTVQAIVARFMACIEEIVNIPDLLTRLDEVAERGSLGDILDEIIRQSMVEFNVNIPGESC